MRVPHLLPSGLQDASPSFASTFKSDHSLRLCLRFYDAKKYKKTPAKSQWDWCQVARMAADGYKFVDGSPWAGHVSKKRKSPKTRSK